MLPAHILEAFSTVAAFIADRPEHGAAVCTAWRAPVHGGAAVRPEVELSGEVALAVDLLEDALPALTRSDEDVPALGEVFRQPAGPVLLSWCSASTWRRDARLAPLLAIAAAQRGFLRQVTEIAS